MRDDPRIFVTRTDLSGGINNRQHGTTIKDNQSETLENVDLSIPGQTQKRPGNLLAKDLGDGEAGTGAFGFSPEGQSSEIIVTHGDELEGSTDGSTFTTHKNDFSSGSNVRFVQGIESGEGDILFVKMSGNNWFRMTYGHSFQDLGNTSGTGSDSPPSSDVGLFFRKRFWVLKSNNLYFSSAEASDYSTAFDTVTDYFPIPVGTEKALLAIRDMGIIIMGDNQIWGLNPSATPVATDKPEKVLDMGCAEGKTAVSVGDDIIFLAHDGVRGLFRTQQDKIQLGHSDPLSYPIKDEFESVNWASINKATAVYFDNKYFIALPVDGSSSNNEVWVYYLATGAWSVITGWNVGGWAKLRIGNEEKLYYIDSTEDKVYRAWTGTDDNGTAISYTEIGRKENIAQPHKKKIGGEVVIKCRATSGTLTVKAAFDDGGFQTLGTLDVSGNNIDFTAWSLPMNFSTPNIAFDKFPLDSYGSWYYIQLKLEHSDSSSVKILERDIITLLEEYEADDSA